MKKTIYDSLNDEVMGILKSKTLSKSEKKKAKKSKSKKLSKKKEKSNKKKKHSTKHVDEWYYELCTNENTTNASGSVVHACIQNVINKEKPDLYSGFAEKIKRVSEKSDLKTSEDAGATNEQ